jgi:hypothetical protein
MNTAVKTKPSTRFAIGKDKRLYISIYRNKIQKARRDISKLVPHLVIDKNGHQRKVYVKLGLPMKKDEAVKKEPYGSSTEKAKELTAEDYGIDELEAMAKPVREAHTFDEAHKILEGMVGHPMISRSHLIAVLSNNSIKKILSGPAVADSVSRDAHLMAAANLDKLFANAIEPWLFELNPNKHNENVKDVHRLYAPLEYDGKIIAVKITVKEMKGETEGTRIYSIEAIDAKIK